MKIIVRNKKYIEDVIRTGCYSLRHQDKMYWGDQAITSKEEFKTVINQFCKKHIHANHNRILILTPTIKVKQLCKIIDNY